MNITRLAVTLSSVFKVTPLITKQIVTAAVVAPGGAEALPIATTDPVTLAIVGRTVIPVVTFIPRITITVIGTVILAEAVIIIIAIGITEIL